MSGEPETSATPLRGRFQISAGRLFDDFIVLATGQFLSKVFGFFAFAWLARILTVANYGAVETAVGMAAIGAVALELGTGAVGVRRIARGETSAGTILGSVMTARMLLAIVIAPFLAASYSVLTAPTIPDALFWLFAASLFVVPFSHNWYFQSQEKMAIAGFGLTLKMGVFLIAILALAPQKNGVLQVGYAEILAAAAMGLWFSILASRSLKPARPRYSLREGSALLGESASLGGSAFVNTLAQYLPLLIVASLSTTVETAEFGAAQRLFVSLITFSFVYYFNLYPLMARLIADDPPALNRVIAASVRVTSWTGVLAATMLSSLAPFVMEVAFGKDFEGAGAELGVLVWSGPLILASGNARWLLVAGKRQTSLLAAQISAAVTAIALCLVLTPSLGGLGAAIASNCGALALWVVAHRRTRGLPVRPSLADCLPATFAAASVIAALTILKPGLWPGFAACMLIVFAGMVLDRKFRASIKVLAVSKSAA